MLESKVRFFFAENLVKFPSRIILFSFLEPVSLSSPQPEFKQDGRTFRDCLFLHHLIVTGQVDPMLTSHQLNLTYFTWQGDEVLRRKQELCPSIFSHTCKIENGSSQYTQYYSITEVR